MKTTSTSTPTNAFTRRKVLLATAAGSAVALAGPALGQGAWPQRPIRMVVPNAAGLSIDVVARLVADQLSHALGQPVIVDNKPGAAGIIGTDIVAKSPADGYTVLYAPTAVFSLNPFIYAKQPYNLQKDLVPVAHVTNVQFMLMTALQNPFRTLPELMNAARAQPNTLTYGSLGIGSAAHVLTEMLCNMAGVRMLHVPYKSTFMTDLLSSQIHVAFDPTTTSLPMVSSGKLRPLGVTSKARNPVAPDIPTIAEVIPGFEGDHWHGVFAPAGTPADVITRLNAEINRILDNTAIQTRLRDLGIQPAPKSVDGFAQFLRTDTEKWGRVVRANNIQAD